MSNGIKQFALKSLVNVAKIFEDSPTKPGPKWLNSSTLISICDTMSYAGLGVLTAAAIMFNKNIPQDKKDFMVPQEWAEAAINCISVFTLNKAVTELSGRPVEKGLFYPAFRISDKLLESKELTNKQLVGSIQEAVAKPNVQKAINDLRNSKIITLIKDGHLDDIKKLVANEPLEKIVRSIVDSKEALKDRAKQKLTQKLTDVGNIISKNPELKGLVRDYPHVLDEQAKNINQLRSNFRSLGSILGLVCALSMVMPFFVNKFATWYRDKYGSNLKSIPDKPASLNPLGAKPLTKNPLFEDFKTGKINFGERSKMAKTKAPAFTSYTSGLRI